MGRASVPLLKETDGLADDRVGGRVSLARDQLSHNSCIIVIEVNAHFGSSFLLETDVTVVTCVGSELARQHLELDKPTVVLVFVFTEADVRPILPPRPPDVDPTGRDLAKSRRL